MTLHVYRAHCAESAAAHEIRMAEMETYRIPYSERVAGKRARTQRRLREASRQIDLAARHWVSGVAEMMEWVNR
jgi:hypothetical protein